jgi:hypothetical protein
MSPLRPPDVQPAGGLVTYQQRRQASRGASAYDLANRVFNAALPYFGRQTQMPLVYWQARTPGARPLVNMPQGPRAPLAQTVPGGELTDPVARQTGVMAYPNVLRYRQTPLARQFFSDVFLHELAHTQQDPKLFLRQRYSPLTTEGAADAFAALARGPVARRAGFGPPPMPYRSGYGPLGQQYLQQFGPRRALSGQFRWGR